MCWFSTLSIILEHKTEMEQATLAERKFDRQLQIKTVGLRDWGNKVSAYNRYEATPYGALKKLFQQYKFHKNDRVVDFGCGKGRVTFYIHHHFKIPVTGVEAHDKTFAEALENKQTYRKKRQHIKAPILLEYALAEQYEVKEEDNCFYFFNPFSIKIFKRVIMNILKSIKENKRTVELILYYPLPEFKEFLQMQTPFEMINKIRVPGDHGKYGKFVIYRASIEEQETSPS